MQNHDMLLNIGPGWIIPPPGIVIFIEPVTNTDYIVTDYCTIVYGKR